MYDQRVCRLGGKNLGFFCVVASQITSVSRVYLTVCSGADQRKHQSSTPLSFVREFTSDLWIPAQMASNAEKVAIWWRHQETVVLTTVGKGKSMAWIIGFMYYIVSLSGVWDNWQIVVSSYRLSPNLKVALFSQQGVSHLGLETKVAKILLTKYFNMRYLRRIREQKCWS